VDTTAETVYAERASVYVRVTVDSWTRSRRRQDHPVVDETATKEYG
jgi:hypothetical protein